jgi:hypothetical protein
LLTLGWWPKRPDSIGRYALAWRMGSTRWLRASRASREPHSPLGHMHFELWDAELGVSLGSYASEDEALAAVRTLCDQNSGLRAALGLIRDQDTIVATGDALVERAVSRA